MKVVVTGASGFLGEKLCHGLLKHGHHVRALVRRTSDVSGLPSPTTVAGFELTYGDVTDYASLLAAFSGCHIIFHAAAAVGSWLPDPSTFFTVNVGGLKNVIRAAKETVTVEKIIFTSSMSAFGPTDGYVADENQVHQGKRFCTDYERSKVAADKVMLQAAAAGVPIVAVYPGNIYGPGKINAGNSLAKLLIARLNGQLSANIGNGKERFSFCYIDDVVEGHIAAMEKGRVGQKYLLTGENASFTRIFETVATITNTKPPRITVPLWVLSVLAWLSLLLFHLFGKDPAITPQGVDAMRHQWSYSCEKAKKELDYDPRSLKEGLEDMLLWLKSKGAIDY